MAEEVYQRLTRSKPSQVLAIAVYSLSSLWLGSNHLLCVNTSGFAETYKRFYFRDIQALTVRLTSRRTNLNWTLGILSAVAWGSLAFALVSQSVTMAGACAVLLVVFGLPLLVNNLLGSTCAVEIRTAVQTETLPSLNRLRETRTILSRIRPLIEQAQGLLTPEEVAARMRQSVASPDLTEVVLPTDIPEPRLPPRLE